MFKFIRPLHFKSSTLALTLSTFLFFIGAQATDTFDKSAYLDLNTEYNQTVVNKKDSKTTTFLKEVGGTLRNALGSTDSDNAGELSHKISSGLKTQTINKAEGLMNDKANQFLNQFGSGRAEISINGLSSKELNYNIRSIQPIYKPNDKTLTFFQFGSGKNIGNPYSVSNIGIGHRILIEDDMVIAGINVFHDYKTKSRHKRLSLGLEYQRTNFGVSVNTYHQLLDKKTIAGNTEEALAGYDAQLTGQVPWVPWVTIKGGHYFWDFEVGDNIKGNIIGIEVELMPSISFEFGQEYSNDMITTAKLIIKFPFDDNEQLIDFAIADKPFEYGDKMDLTELDWVERFNKIQIENVQ